MDISQTTRNTRAPGGAKNKIFVLLLLRWFQSSWRGVRQICRKIADFSAVYYWILAEDIMQDSFCSSVFRKTSMGTCVLEETLKRVRNPH